MPVAVVDALLSGVTIGATPLSSAPTPSFWRSCGYLLGEGLEGGVAVQGVDVENAGAHQTGVVGLDGEDAGCGCEISRGGDEAPRPLRTR